MSDDKLTLKTAASDLRTLERWAYVKSPYLHAQSSRNIQTVLLPAWINSQILEYITNYLCGTEQTAFPDVQDADTLCRCLLAADHLQLHVLADLLRTRFVSVLSRARSATDVRRWYSLPDERFGEEEQRDIEQEAAFTTSWGRKWDAYFAAQPPLFPQSSPSSSSSSSHPASPDVDDALCCPTSPSIVLISPMASTPVSSSSSSSYDKIQEGKLALDEKEGKGAQGDNLADSTAQIVSSETEPGAEEWSEGEGEHKHAEGGRDAMAGDGGSPKHASGVDQSTAAPSLSANAPPAISSASPSQDVAAAKASSEQKGEDEELQQLYDNEQACSNGKVDPMSLSLILSGSSPPPCTVPRLPLSSASSSSTGFPALPQSASMRQCSCTPPVSPPSSAVDPWASSSSSSSSSSASSSCSVCPCALVASASAPALRSRAGHFGIVRQRPNFHVSDDSRTHCENCQAPFSWLYRKHHCRYCGRAICYKCYKTRELAPEDRVSSEGLHWSAGLLVKMKTLSWREEFVCAPCDHNLDTREQVLTRALMRMALPLPLLERVTAVAPRWRQAASFVLSALFEIQYKRPMQTLTASERDALWNNREFWPTHPRWIVQLMRAVNWTDDRQAQEAIHILKDERRRFPCDRTFCSRMCGRSREATRSGHTLSPADALELLGPDVLNEEARRYAVGCLRAASKEEIRCFLPTLVDFIRYDGSRAHCSALVDLLIDCALPRALLHVTPTPAQHASGGNGSGVGKQGSEGAAREQKGDGGEQATQGGLGLFSAFGSLFSSSKPASSSAVPSVPPSGISLAAAGALQSPAHGHAAPSAVPSAPSSPPRDRTEGYRSDRDQTACARELELSQAATQAEVGAGHCHCGYEDDALTADIRAQVYWLLSVAQHSTRGHARLYAGVLQRFSAELGRVAPPLAKQLIESTAVLSLFESANTKEALQQSLGRVQAEAYPLYLPCDPFRPIAQIDNKNIKECDSATKPWIVRCFTPPHGEPAPAFSSSSSSSSPSSSSSSSSPSSLGKPCEPNARIAGEQGRQEAGRKEEKQQRTDEEAKLESFAVMYKKEDIRKDQIIIGVIRLMDVILRRELGVDLNILTYACVPTSVDGGFIQIVPDSESLGDSQDKLIHRLQNHQTDAKISEVRETFLKSMAAWSIITLLLGVGDRHRSNIMLSSSKGVMFHIDYGYVLGQDPKLMMPRVRVDDEMIEAIGGPREVKHSQYPDYERYCRAAYLCLRKHLSLFSTLLMLLPMSDPPIAGLHFTKEYLDKELSQRFLPGYSDEAALESLQYWMAPSLGTSLAVAANDGLREGARTVSKIGSSVSFFSWVPWIRPADAPTSTS